MLLEALRLRCCAGLDQLVQHVVAMLAGPIGFAAAGPLLEELGTRAVFAVVATGTTTCALYFASVAPRDSRLESLSPPT